MWAVVNLFPYKPWLQQTWRVSFTYFNLKLRNLRDNISWHISQVQRQFSALNIYLQWGLLQSTIFMFTFKRLWNWVYYEKILCTMVHTQRSQYFHVSFVLLYGEWNILSIENYKNYEELNLCYIIASKCLKI